MYRNIRTSVKIFGLNFFGLGLGICTNASCDYDPSLMKQYEGKVIDGRTFKNIFKDYFPCKVVGDNHNSFAYKLGVVKNNEEFNPSGNCQGGGLYFTDVKNVLSYFDHYGINIAILELLNDEKIYVEGSKCKTNSFIVKNILSIRAFVEYLEQTDYENLMAFIKSQPWALSYVENQTVEMCEQAVKNNWQALEYVKNQTEEICKLAVMNDHRQYSHDNEDYFILNDQRALGLVENQTEEICKLSVKNDGLTLKFVKNQTEEICKLAIDQELDALKYVKNQTPEICKYAIDKNVCALGLVDVENQTEELCKYVLDKDPDADVLIKRRDITTKY